MKNGHSVEIFLSVTGWLIYIDIIFMIVYWRINVVLQIIFAEYMEMVTSLQLVQIAVVLSSTSAMKTIMPYRILVLLECISITKKDNASMVRYKAFAHFQQVNINNFFCFLNS